MPPRAVSKYRVIDCGVLEHHLGACWTAHIAGEDLRSVNVDAVGGGHPDPLAGSPHDVRDHPNSCGLTVGPGDSNDRHASAGARWEEHIHHCASNVARVALCRMRVHAETWPGIDLDDCAPCLPDGLGNVGGDEVDASNIQSDDHRSLPSNLRVVRVNVIGSMDRGATGAHVTGLLQRHYLTGTFSSVDPWRSSVSRV